MRRTRGGEAVSAAGKESARQAVSVMQWQGQATENEGTQVSFAGVAAGKRQHGGEGREKAHSSRRAGKLRGQKKECQ